MLFSENSREKYFLKIKFKMLSLREAVLLILVKLSFVKSARSCGKTRSFLFIVHDEISTTVSVEVNDIRIGRKHSKSFDFLAKPFARCHATFSRSFSWISRSFLTHVYVSSQLSRFSTRTNFNFDLLFNFDRNIFSVRKIQIFMRFYGEFEPSFVDSNLIFDMICNIYLTHWIIVYCTLESKGSFFKNLLEYVPRYK